MQTRNRDGRGLPCDLSPVRRDDSSCEAICKPGSHHPASHSRSTAIEFSETLISDQDTNTYQGSDQHTMSIIELRNGRLHETPYRDSLRGRPLAAQGFSRSRDAARKLLFPPRSEVKRETRVSVTEQRRVLIAPRTVLYMQLTLSRGKSSRHSSRSAANNRSSPPARTPPMFFLLSRGSFLPQGPPAR